MGSVSPWYWICHIAKITQKQPNRQSHFPLTAAGFCRNAPVPFLMSYQYRTFRAGSCRVGSCLGYQPVLNEDNQKNIKRIPWFLVSSQSVFQCLDFWGRGDGGKGKEKNNSKYKENNSPQQQKPHWKNVLLLVGGDSSGTFFKPGFCARIKSEPFIFEDFRPFLERSRKQSWRGFQKKSKVLFYLFKKKSNTQSKKPLVYVK